jgi:hypothetical protein
LIAVLFSECFLSRAELFENLWRMNIFLFKIKKKKKKTSRAWWCMPLIPALGRQRQGDF